MNRLVASAAVFMAIGASVFAATEKKELMTVEFNDGTEAVVYDVSKVSKVSFSVEENDEYEYVVTPGEGDPFQAEVVTHLFRVNGTDGSRTQCAMGYAPDATDLAGLKASKYVVVFEIQSTGEYTFPADGATVKLYEYADGEFVGETDGVAEGGLSYSVNAKTGNVTVNLDATFENGTHVEAVYDGSATEVESLSDLLPAVEVTNEYKYYDFNGNLTTYSISGVTKETNPKIQGVQTSFVKYNFTIEGYNGDVFIAFDPKYNGKEVDFAKMTTPDFIVKFGGAASMNLSGPDNEFYAMQGIKGSFTVTDNGDGTVKVEADITNLYFWYGSNGGNNKRVVITYEGPVS